MFEDLVGGDRITGIQKEPGGQNPNQGLDGDGRLLQKKTVLTHRLFLAAGALERKRVIGSKRKILRIQRQPQFKIVCGKIMESFLTQPDTFERSKP